MARELESHSTAIALSEPAAAEVAAGADLAVKVKVSCSAGCDLRGLPLSINGPDDAVATGTLTTCEAGVNESGEIALKAPLKVGPQSWTIDFGPHEAQGIRHDACSLSISITTIPHGTSLAVWDIPSPVVIGQRFAIKVGAKSAANCDLKDLDIAVYDKNETVVARGRLQDTPWPGTTALYWTEVELPAPDTKGLNVWSVRFAADELALPHEGAVTEFSAIVAPPPEHRLTVRVIEQDSKAPIEDVQVRLGAFRAATDPSGLAQVMMPKGSYDLHVWKAGYEAPARAIEIKADLAVEVEAAVLPEEDPDAAWTM